jgi:hypothetical protein
MLKANIIVNDDEDSVNELSLPDEEEEDAEGDGDD